MVEPQFRFRDDSTITEAAVGLEAFLGGNGGAVRIEPGEDARALLPHLDRLRLVEVAFPAYTDGRGYSSARILREAGYRQELRAVGDVLIDQLFPMRRVGFDSFAPNAPLNEADAQAAFTRYPEVYQVAADARQPIWAHRHG